MDTEVFTPALYESRRNPLPETSTEMRLHNGLKPHINRQLYQSNPLNEDEYRNMRALLRPVLWLMALQGLFHPSKLATSTDTPTLYRYHPFTRWVTITLSLCNICYMFSNFVVLVTAHPTVDLTSFYVDIYIILLVWLATATILAALQFFICEHSSRYDRIWEKWAYRARHSRRRNWRRMTIIRNVYLCFAGMLRVVIKRNNWLFYLIYTLYGIQCSNQSIFLIITHNYSLSAIHVPFYSRIIMIN